MKVNHMERAKVVKAMETMARCINNENIFEFWLWGGVADGDITEDTTLEDIIDEGYTKDETFKDLLDLFMKLMYKASKDGGLYCNYISSKMLHTEWK